MESIYLSRYVIYIRKKNVFIRFFHSSLGVAYVETSHILFGPYNWMNFPKVFL